MNLDVTRRSWLAGAAAAVPVRRRRSAGRQEETGYAQVPGGKVWWRRVGTGPGTPLLLLHGGPGMGHDYLLPLEALADERPVIFYDQLGCGRSDAPDDPGLYRIDRFVREVGALRSALGLRRIVLFGNSWGSMLAIEYMIVTGGPGVERLILSGALASVPQAVAGMGRLLDALPDGAGARIRALEAQGKTDGPEYDRLVQLFYDTHLCRLNPKPAAYEASMAIGAISPAYRVMNGPNEFTIVGNIKDWERRPDLGRITVPTFITSGQYDEVTLDCQLDIQKGIKGADLEVFGDCSHLTMLEKPLLYAKAVRDFIA